MPRIIYILFFLVIMTSQSLFAYYPSVSISFKNLKIKRSQQAIISKALLDYLNESPEILKEKKQIYKVDQFCRFAIDLDPETKNIDLNTIDVLDKKKNIAFNLRVIDFLRSYELGPLTKKNDEKKIEMKFYYYAF